MIIRNHIIDIVQSQVLEFSTKFSIPGNSVNWYKLSSVVDNISKTIKNISKH